MCAQRIALSSSFNVYFLGIPDKVCLCVGYAYIRLHTHTQKNQQKTLCGGTQLTSSSWSRSLFSERKCKRMKTLQPLWDKSPLVHVRMCVCVCLHLCVYCGGTRRLVCVDAGWPVRALWFCRLSRMLLAKSLTSACVCGCVWTSSSCCRPPSSNSMLQ